MKKIITTIALLSLANFAYPLIESKISPELEAYYRENDLIKYPMLFLLGKNDVEKDEVKAFKILLDMTKEDITMAKVALAYCYFTGTGCEVDVAKAEEYLRDCKTETLKLDGFNRDTKWTFRNDKFSLKIADVVFEKTGDFELAYKNFLHSSSFKYEHESLYKKLLELADKEPEKYANYIINDLIESKDYEKAVKFSKYSTDTNNKKLLNLLGNLIIEQEDKLVAQLLENLEAISYNLNIYYFEYAYCLNFGIGVEKDEKKAQEILAKYLKDEYFWSYLVYNIYWISKDAKETKQLEKFILDYAIQKKDAGEASLYAICQKNGIAIDKDLTAYLAHQYKKIENKYERSPTYEILGLISNRSERTKEMIEIRFKTLKLQCENEGDRSHALMQYCHYLINGVGCEKNGKLAIELLENNYNNPAELKWSSEFLPFEYLAYCYDKGIYVKENKQKAEEIRAKITELVESTKNFGYSNLEKLYAKKSLVGQVNDDIRIGDEALMIFYKEKEYKRKLLKDVNSESEKKSVLKVIELAKNFSKDDAKSKADLSKIMQDFLDNKSPVMKDIYDFTMSNKTYPNQDFKDICVPYLEEAAKDFIPEVLSALALCYANGSGVIANRKKYADLSYLSAINPKTPDDTAKSNLFSAFRTYLELNEFEDAKKTYEFHNKFDPNIYVERQYLSLISQENSPYRDIEKASKIFEKILENANTKTELENAIQSVKTKLESKYTFLLAKKAYDLGSRKSTIEGRLIDNYTYGIFAEKDINKAVEIAINMTQSRRYYDPYSLLKTLYLDSEDKDQELFKKLIDTYIDNKREIASVYFFKALAMHENYGYEMDEGKFSEYLKKAFAGSCNGGSFLYNDDLKLSKEFTLKALPYINPSKKASLAILNTKIGEYEKALEYAKDNPTLSMQIALFKDKTLDANSIEKLKASKDYNARIFYATLLYKGQCVEKDEAKALEILEECEKAVAYNRSSSMIRINYLWLWQIYTDKNETQKAEEILKALYYRNFAVIALDIYRGERNFDYIFDSNIEPKEAYAKFWQDYAEGKALEKSFSQLFEKYKYSDKSAQKRLIKKLRQSLEY